MIQQEFRAATVRAIVLGAAAGLLWVVLVRPLHATRGATAAELTEARAMLAQARDVSAQDAQPPAAALERLTEAEGLIDSLWESTPEGQLLYRALSEAVEDQGLILERVEPRVSGGVAGSEGYRLSAIAYGCEVIGQWSDVVRLLDALEEELGLSRIESFRIVGAEGADGSVRLSVRTTHFSPAPTSGEGSR